MLLLAFSAMAPSAAKAAPPQPEVTKPFQLTTLKGDTYENCYILKRTPEGLSVLHDKGVTKISFVVLGDEWRKKYRYDATKAAEFVKAETERKEQLIASERERQAAQQAAAAEAVLANAETRLASSRAAGYAAAQVSSLARTYWSDNHSSRYYSRSRYRYRYPYSSYYGSTYYYPVYYYSSPVCRTRTRTSVSSVGGSSSRVSSAPRSNSVMRVGR
jgi:hypothetical protein